MARWPCLLLPALVACGSDPIAPEGAGGSSSSVTTSVTTGGNSQPLVLHASFVAETEPGEGPSLLRLANDTVDEKLSITLPDGEAFAFYAVDWLTTTDYVPAAVDVPVEDVVVSVHTTDNVCVRIHLDEIAGAQILEPLHAYTLHVTLPETGFEAELIEEALPEPFLGLRAMIDDPTAAAAMTKLELTVSGEAATFEKIFIPSQPMRYALLSTTEAEVEALSYTDGKGKSHVLESALSLPSAPGYTVVIADAPVEGAAATVELVAQ